MAGTAHPAPGFAPADAYRYGQPDGDHNCDPDRDINGNRNRDALLNADSNSDSHRNTNRY